MEHLILQLQCKKHIKIYKLSQLGKTNKEIAKLVNTNQGHVWNVVNAYKNNPEKVKAANDINVTEPIDQL